VLECTDCVQPLQIDQLCVCVLP